MEGREGRRVKKHRDNRREGKKRKGREGNGREGLTIKEDEKQNQKR